MAKAQSLSDMAKALKPRKKLTWVDRLDSKLRGELLELRAKYQANEFDVGPTAMYRSLVKQHIGGQVTEGTFVRWMGKK